jgi:ribonuclease HII
MIVCGIDEVGRGPLAGPVVAAAVVLSVPIEGVADSKTLAAARREVLAEAIRAEAQVGLGAASAAEIDRLNILQATFLAMRRALARLPVPPDRVLVDGNQDPRLGLPTSCVIGGDACEPAIGAASIVAKVVRDRLMARLALRHPGYGFEHNAGYPTPEHLLALTRLGPSSHHRRSFAPCRQQLSLLTEAGAAAATEIDADELS